MSFNNAFTEDLEDGSRGTSRSNYKDYPDFDNYSQLIDNGIYNINRNYLTSIKSLLLQYEGIQKSEDVSSIPLKLEKLSLKLSQLFKRATENYKSVNESTKNLNNYLKQCESNHEDEDALQYLKRKESISIKSVKSSLEQFQKLQKRYELLQQKTVLKFGHHDAENLETHSSANVSTEPNTQVSVQIDYEPVNAEELEQQTLLIEEREREIHQISQDISEINDIFLNLHEIINEQQFAIDNIEDNIVRFHDDARGASGELRKAERYQKRSGGRMFCCLLILIIVLGSIILIGVIF